LPSSDDEGDPSLDAQAEETANLASLKTTRTEK
jgi:hypothetical protein